MIIAVDFDGTLCTHEFPEIGRDIGAFSWLKKWQEAGARLMLWTMRNDGRGGDFDTVLTEAVDFCRSNGIEFWGINCNPEQGSWTQSPKQYANLYIDDAGYGIPLIYSDGERPYVDWDEVGPAVLKMLTKEDCEAS